MKPQDVDSWDVELGESKNSGLETAEYLAEGHGSGYSGEGCCLEALRHLGVTSLQLLEGLHSQC